MSSTAHILQRVPAESTVRPIRPLAAVRTCVGALREPSALDVERMTQHPVNAGALELVDSYLPCTTTNQLFHYAGLDGFVGIVTTGRLWATHSDFLNDPTELRYCEAILQAAVEHVAHRAPAHVGSFVRAYVAQILREAAGLGVYLTSFSEADDLLSQWMTYTPAASGVAIGFDGAVLSQLPFVTLRKVLYDRRQQSRMLRALLRIYIEPLRRAFDRVDQEGLQTLGVMLGMLIHQCMLCFKNPAFAPEREWRLIVVFHQGTPSETCVRYRVSSRALVPYVEIPLINATGTLPVTDIVVGPALDFDLNSVSLARFLKSHAIGSTPRPSKVPFRTMR